VYARPTDPEKRDEKYSLGDPITPAGAPSSERCTANWRGQTQHLSPYRVSPRLGRYPGVTKPVTPPVATLKRYLASRQTLACVMLLLAVSTAYAVGPKLSADTSDLVYTAAAVRFMDTYRSTGMAGATVEIKDWYTRASSTFRFSCIALDATGLVMTYAFSKNSFPPPTEYLSEPAFRARIKSQLRLAGMRGDKQMNVYIDALVDRCSTALTAEGERHEPRR
jgi:hypothetical protein